MRSHKSVGPTVRWATPSSEVYKASRKHVAPSHGLAAHDARHPDDVMDAPHDATIMRPYVFGGRDDD